jgi:hypothetical protein
LHSPSTQLNSADVGTLLRAEAQAIAGWVEDWSARRVGTQVLIILLGAGAYGAAMGWWRDPWQAAFVAIKFPLILLLTALGNALLNAMLAPLLGLNITLRQSLLAVLMSFAITAVILGAFAPLTGFLAWNAPPMTPDVKSTPTYAFVKLSHVVVIAFAGLAGNVRLFQLLTSLSQDNRRVARRVLFAWLAGNLFLGSQLTWIARPFIGAPQLPVAFLRDEAFRGNFYENVLGSILQLFRSL